MSIKVGLGFDIHRLVNQRPLYLGGIAVPFPQGLLGHSDGDCLVHALIDAILGAAGEGDIGQLFPDSDPRFKDIPSLELLHHVMNIIKEKQMRLINLDSVIIAEEPPLAPHIPRMKEILSPVLMLSRESISIKAKTNEKLGPIGHQEAIAAWACVLLEKTG